MANYALTNYAKDNMLDYLATQALYASLHSSEPDATGSNEVAGGSPAYARKSVSWIPAAGGLMSITATETFDIPVGATVAYAGIWDASSGGNFLGYSIVTLHGPYTGQGTYILNTFVIAL